jgi:hypothetical protein
MREQRSGIIHCLIDSSRGASYEEPFLALSLDLVLALQVKHLHHECAADEPLAVNLVLKSGIPKVAPKPEHSLKLLELRRTSYYVDEPRALDSLVVTRDLAHCHSGADQCQSRHKEAACIAIEVNYIPNSIAIDVLFALQLAMEDEYQNTIGIFFRGCETCPC